MSKKRFAKLVKLRRQLKKDLASKKGSKNEIKKINDTLTRVDLELRKIKELHKVNSPHRRGNEDLSMTKAVDLNSIGGLQFQASSPPGIGRLVSLPFYPYSVNDDVTTSSGQNKSSNTNPVCILSVGNTIPNAVSSFSMRTPQISWAKLRVVGFEVDIRTNCAQNTSTPTLLVSDLKIGGGTNLFTHEDYSDGMFYSNKNDYYAGLRDYPLLISPNDAMVTISAVSPTTSGDTITFSAQLVCEVLEDENYGTHIPGPYARGASMVRNGGKLK
jgi:hypothetical protein